MTKHTSVSISVCVLHLRTAGQRIECQRCPNCYSNEMRPTKNKSKSQLDVRFSDSIVIQQIQAETSFEHDCDTHVTTEDHTTDLH